MGICPDCPDLEFSPDRPEGPLRAKCCRDELLDLRREGVELDATEGVEQLRKTLDRRAQREAERLVRVSTAYGNRAQRRERAAKVRKETKR